MVTRSASGPSSLSERIASSSIGSSVAATASTTTASAAPSQASPMAATRNSSSIGAVSGSRSSMSASGGITVPARSAISSSSSFMRSARTCTWVFSRATLTVRPESSEACR
jgi:hypothetical protein